MPLAHGLLAPGHGAGSGAWQRSGQDPKNHMIIRVLAPAHRDGGRDEAARPLEVGCRRDAPAWVTQHLASGASAGVRRRASSDEAMGRRGHAPGAAGGALAEALPGGRRVASPLWAMATPGRALPEGFGSLCRTAAAKMQAFYAPGLATRLWAIAVASRALPEVFSSRHWATAAKVQDFNAQGLARTLWAVAKTCRGLLTVFVSLCWPRLSARQRSRSCSTRERWPARSRQWPTRAHGGEACVTLFRDS